ncbi:MAG: hypothetical protein PHV49_04300, partial [Alistipes sp.]|nr:hypothetical protein [Alistipes sp.]
IGANEIGAIEQKFVMKNLSADPATATPEKPATAASSAKPAGKQVANLIYNAYFKENLAPEDYKALRQAQEWERIVPSLLQLYSANYQRLDSLSRIYDTTAQRSLAEECYEKLGTLQRLNGALDDSIGHVWSAIFDSKSFAYNYLLDKMGKSDRLKQFEEQFRTTRQHIAEKSDSVVSLNVYGYPANKALVLGYEQTLATELGYAAAQDSLKKQIAAVRQLHYDLPALNIEERNFIVYGDIVRNTGVKYGASNPIPELEVCRQGTVYRVMVGSFTQKQAVSIFRGVSPLCYEKGEDGRYRYYAGAYHEESQVQDAVEQMRGYGFRKPEAVVWRNGIFEKLGDGDAESSESGPLYRVEISGQGENINPDLKALTAQQAAEKELTRVADAEGNYLYSIGNFSSRQSAEELATALNAVIEGCALVRELPRE